MLVLFTNAFDASTLQLLTLPMTQQMMIVLLNDSVEVILVSDSSEFIEETRDSEKSSSFDPDPVTYPISKLKYM